jgi:cyclase
MLRNRVIPILLHDKGGLVKTCKFKDPVYIGDPLNAIRIFNNKHVDELILLDIGRTRDGVSPDFELVRRVVSECFMPLGYGGGIRTLNDAQKLFSFGVEKVILQTITFDNMKVLEDIASFSGNQSVSISVDVKRDRNGAPKIYNSALGRVLDLDISEYLRSLENGGAGEIVLTSVDREGTFSGFDLELISLFKASLNIPLVVNGGAGSIEDFQTAIDFGAEAVAAGSFFVFYSSRRGVLLNYPSPIDFNKRVRQGNQN